MNLYPVSATDLVSVWPFVRKGLEKCVEKAGGHYLPEDVYAGIKGGVLHLFMVEDVGFVVFRRDVDPDAVVLFVFALWVEPNVGMPRGTEVMAAIRFKAREIGAKRIRMQSGRKGWERLPFMDPVATVYESEV